jgi:hypothetical protein
VSANVELPGATFKVRVAPDLALSETTGLLRVDCDFLLRMKTPAGPQEWRFHFSHQDLDVSGLGRGEPPERFFRGQMETMFEDHLYDLAEVGWEADKAFDDHVVSVEVPDEVLEVAPRVPAGRPDARKDDGL